MKKAIIKFSILIPVLGGLYFFFLGRDFNSFMLQLTIPSKVLAIAYVVFALLWIFFSPLKESCCDSTKSEVFFYYFPVGIWSALYFVQGHPVILIFLVGLLYWFPKWWTWLEKSNNASWMRELRKEHPPKWFYHHYFLKTCFILTFQLMVIQLLALLFHWSL